jgi:hypothetical protein
MLQYYERHPDEVDDDALESLGKLGDPPGSTVVRDRLLAEVNNKRRKLDLRYGAALGLKAMGMAELARPVLDIKKALNTHSNLGVVKNAMGRLAAEKGVKITSQTAVDVLLRDVEGEKQDLWNRPLRAGFVSENLFHVVSDGPDMTPATQDDLSTAEDVSAYLYRVFPDQFLRL